MTDIGLLANLALALGLAALFAAVAVRLGQSTIIGFTLAGILIGPYTPAIFSGDPNAVEALANIGVSLLMFSIGVQLSVRELLNLGRIATLGGLLQVAVIMGIGYLIGVALGWPTLEALFFGAVLSNSSSTVISKVLGDRGEISTEHGQIALAWSTIQDLSTIVLVAALSVLATQSSLVWSDLAWATGQSVLFLILLIPVGSWVFPRLFERVAALRNREVFILMVAAIALGTAFIASLFGLSLALGAFVAGVVISESDLSDQIFGEMRPLRDVFAGIFFVSVGMFVDPLFVLQNVPLFALTLALIMIVKVLVVSVLVPLFGYSRRTALLSAVALGQCAEFSFLLARVGADLNAVTPQVFSLMLAASVASILLVAPAYNCVRASGQLLERFLPSPSQADHPALSNPSTRPRRHAILCGYGHVGSVIGAALRRRGFTVVVIEQDARLVRQLQEHGITALLGNADTPALLELANVDEARLLVIAIPDPLAARLIAQYARQANPRLAIVARTHSEDERLKLEQLGVGEAVVGERELALEMTRYALHRFGVPAQEAQAIVQGLRTQAAEQGAVRAWELEGV